jgi:hypothetical protein
VTPSPTRRSVDGGCSIQSEQGRLSNEGVSFLVLPAALMWWRRWRRHYGRI